MSTRNLQLASMQFCLACRSVATLRVRIGNETPKSLLAPSIPPTCQKTIGDTNAAGNYPSRVPPLRALCVIWERLTKYLAYCYEMELFTNLKWLEFANFFVGSLDFVVWPEGLQRLVLRGRLDLPRKPVSWPLSLRRLELGKYFNKSIIDVVLPAALEHLVFGERFNHPIVGVAWPASLRTMKFGDFFNQLVVGVVWPASLQTLSIAGTCFRQTIEGVVWPASLRCLTLSYYFNHPIERVAWPSSLEKLEFGFMFDQPIAGVVWPASLRMLTFGDKFCQPVERIVWPVSMHSLTINSQTYKVEDGILSKEQEQQTCTSVDVIPYCKYSRGHS